MGTSYVVDLLLAGRKCRETLEETVFFLRVETSDYQTVTLLTIQSQL